MKREELIALVEELTTPKYRVTSSHEFGEKLVKDIGHLSQEHYIVLVLDQQHQILGQKTLNIGRINYSLVDLAELARTILSYPKAIGFITAHNHPGGSLEPSSADHEVRDQVRGIAELFRFSYIDDLIISNKDYWSARENGFLE